MNTVKITKEALAERLNGRLILAEITREEERMARESGLVVVFGYSDDNVEFRGAINDEIGAGDKTSIILDDIEIFQTWDQAMEDELTAQRYFAKKGKGKEIIAIFDAPGKAAWTFETKIPHAKFNIMEDGDVFCIGIVINAEDLKS